MTKTKTITEQHLEAALAVHWSLKTCLIAQAFGGPSKVEAADPERVLFLDGSQIQLGLGGAEAMRLFDKGVPPFKELRKLLPLEIEYQEDSSMPS